MKREKQSPDLHSHGGIIRPQGAPRGLLAHYVLHTISLKPKHGYEILQELESKTDGAWRPGAGSIYPVLKKFVSQGYIRSDSAPRTLATAQRIYRITPRGEQYLKKVKDMFADMGQRWASMRRVFVEFIGEKNVSKFLVDGSRLQFQIWQEVLESKADKLPRSEVEYILKEYILSLERQLEWSHSKLSDTKKQERVPVTA